MLGTRHQVQSVLSPPILILGSCPGERFEISCSSTGLIAFGSRPAYASIARYSSDRPRNPRWIGGPLSDRGSASAAFEPSVVIGAEVRARGSTDFRARSASARPCFECRLHPPVAVVAV